MHIDFVMCNNEQEEANTSALIKTRRNDATLIDSNN